jgi:hypothetical protein
VEDVLDAQFHKVNDMAVNYIFDGGAAELLILNILPITPYSSKILLGITIADPLFLYFAGKGGAGTNQ